MQAIGQEVPQTEIEKAHQIGTMQCVSLKDTPSSTWQSRTVEPVTYDLTYDWKMTEKWVRDYLDRNIDLETLKKLIAERNYQVTPQLSHKTQFPILFSK